MALARPLGVLDLPDDVLFVVFDHLLGLEPLDGTLQLVCRRFRALLVRPAPVFCPPAAEIDRYVLPAGALWGPSAQSFGA